MKSVLVSQITVSTPKGTPYGVTLGYLRGGVDWE